MERIVDDVRRTLASLDDNLGAADYEAVAIRTAVWAHAEVIQVHPFEDGNGRTCRLLMNWFLLRAGLRPIAVEVPKREYRDCLNHYFRTKELQPLIDLALGLYPLG